MKRTKNYLLTIVSIILISALFIISSCTKAEKYNETTTTTQCPWVSPLPPDFCPDGKVIFDECIPKCEPNQDTTTTTIEQEQNVIADLNLPFKLKINEVAFLESENIKVKFLNVIEDSRCPEGGQCFWQGQGKVSINIIKDNKDLGIFTLTILGKEDLGIKNFDGYKIELKELEPYPTLHEKSEEPRTATFVVEKLIESIEIITDRDVYTQYGDDVEIKLKNNGLNPVTLTASNGCAKFFEVINLKTGKSIPLYDKNAICTQATKEITINPGETKIIDYWDKVDYDASECPDTSICKRSKINLGKYKIVVKNQSKIIDIIVYTY